MYLRPLRSIIVATVLTCAAVAHGQIFVTFSGGDNTASPYSPPFSLTVQAPVTYTVTNDTTSDPPYDPDSAAPFFVINGASYGPVGMVTGNVTYTITAQDASNTYPIEQVYGDTDNPDVPDGLVLEGPSETLSVGDTVTLNAGTLTATTVSPFTAPANGSYPTYLVDGYSRVLSGPGISDVPEPSTWAMLLASIGLLVWQVRCSGWHARVSA